MENKWDKEKVQQYINDEIEENSNLDYKAADAHGKKHLPEKLDGIDRILFPKEWLEHIINSIQPRLEGLTIFPVDIDTGQNHVVYVIEIPQSTTAHQAKDYRYYKRFNFESVPMEDYEVRDVMNRSIAPNAQVEFGYIGPKIEGETHSYTLKIIVKNIGFLVINNFKLKITFPNYGSYFQYSPGTFPQYQYPMCFGRVVHLNDKNNDHVLTYHSAEKLFSEDEVDVGKEINCQYKIDDKAYKQIKQSGSKRELSLSWILYADNMLPKRDNIPFSKLHCY